jgi:hypothetical protein
MNDNACICLACNRYVCATVWGSAEIAANGTDMAGNSESAWAAGSFRRSGQP